MQAMTAQRHDRLFRRAPVAVRRDAVETLSNGRMLYDALFSRTGIQVYGSSVEYRPDSEVFAPASLASGALCPGALLHPSENYGTSFSGGVHAVRGSTGEFIVQHTDGVHTSGRLMVWDDEWNTLIQSGEVMELSVGYTIRPDYTPGTAPDGTAYQVVHRDIVWDHVAGVPAGNAGTAKVITDHAHADPVTRKALADIVAMRADARPLYIDFGRRMTSDQNQKDPDMTKTKFDTAIADKLGNGAASDIKALHDAFLEIWGESSDPDMKAALAALGGAARAADAEHEPEPELEPDENAEAGEEMDMDGDEMDGEDKPKMDADIDRAVDVRADLVSRARQFIGSQWSPRVDGKPKTNAEIMREVVEKLDASRLPTVDRFDGAERKIALAMQFDDLCARADKDLSFGHELADEINRTRAARGDGQGEMNEVDIAVERLDEHHKNAATKCFGSR